MEHGGHGDVAVAALGEIFVGQLLEGADGGDVLNEVAALAVADGDVLDALLGGEQRLDDGDGVGDAGRDEGAGQRAVGLTVDRDAGLLIDAGQTVDILPVADGLSIGTFLA